MALDSMQRTYVHHPLRGKKLLKTPVEGIPRELNLLAQKQQINSVSYARCFSTTAIIEGRSTTVMIDSGATGNFISDVFAEWEGFPVRKKGKNSTYDLVVIDGSPLPTGNGRVDEETHPLLVAFQQHSEEITFDVVGMAGHDVVLGMPWLKMHNPLIDWEKRVLTFERCSCVATYQPGRRQSSTTDEKQRRKPPARRELAASSKDSPKRESASTDTSTGQQDHEVRVSEGCNAPSEIHGSTGRVTEPPNEIPSVYREWKALFHEEETALALPKHQPWDHEIKLEPGTQPTFGPIYALSEKELGALRKYLDENMKKGFIRKSQSPAGYPILFVPKKDGTLRLCVDYRKLNNITIKNRYPLPNISELQDRLAGAMYFTKLDLRGAYNLIRMKSGEEWKTAFRTRYGHYEYTVMPFGLTNAPATCQEMINDALREHLDTFVIAYLDDILVYSKTLEEHKRHVSTVLQCLGKRDLRLKPEKCDFHKEQVDFPGFVVGRYGIRIDPAKLLAVKDWPTPKNVKDVQSFVGFVNYVRKFIKNYSARATPLTNLTVKDKAWEWGSKQEEAFPRHEERLS